MSLPFLSDAWFAKVDELVAAAGDLQIPPAMSAAVINLTVTGAPGGDAQLALKNGLFTRGHDPAAPTSISLSAELARKIFVEADAAAGMQAFMAGQIKVEGDVSKLMAMQMVQPSEPQKKLSRQIVALTA